MGVLKHTVKVLRNVPRSFEHCIEKARHKFELYFNHSIKLLLNAFPPDLRMKDGSLFWTLPKRPPVPLDFDRNNEEHVKFVRNTAALFSTVYNIPFDADFWTVERVGDVCEGIVVPTFSNKNKNFVTDESVKEAPKEEVNQDEFQVLCNELERLSGDVEDLDLIVEDFEKDDDTNYHVAFVHSCSTLRSLNYSIKTIDFMETKRIAGKIIPAIATTTATIAGLVSVELIKTIMGNLPIEAFRNTFINIALPVYGNSEPGPPQKIPIIGDAFYTIWDKWEVKGSELTLEQFIAHLKEKHNLVVTGVFHNVVMIFMLVLPNHKPRLKRKLRDLVKDVTEDYVDLIVTFADVEGKDVSGPTIRYYLKD